MTRGEIITQALEVVGDISLTTEAAAWLDKKLLELKTAGLGFWRFLAAETTHQTEDAVYSVPFSATKWPAAALTNYNKGMSIWSAEPRKLTRISKAIYDAGYDAAAGNPEFFALWNKTLYLYPIPVTSSLPLLTIQYYKEITLPTSDGDDLETVVGIKENWQGFLINGVVSEGFRYMNDGRFANSRDLWKEQQGLMLKDNEDFSTPEEQEWDKPSLAVRQQQALAAVSAVRGR